MALPFDVLDVLTPYYDIIQTLLLILIAAVIFSVFLRLIKRSLIKKVKTKKQVANVMAFIDMLTFVFIFFLIIIALASYYGNLGDLGFVAGLLTVALGWALQKPITGVVAWLIIITRRPFLIGDRIIINNITGDVSNITMTHIFLDEVGGTHMGEENSNRSIMIPTNVIFDTDVVNFNNRDEYILDEVSVSITYESDLSIAEKLCLKATERIMGEYWKKFPKRINKEPHTRLNFQPSGIDITVRYMTIATSRNAIATDIRRELFNDIKKMPGVEIAYPHTEVLFREKKTS